MVMEKVEGNITTKRIESFPKLEDENEYESKGPVDLRKALSYCRRYYRLV